MNAKEVKTRFEQACNDYLRLFCEKHEYDFDDAKESWVADDVGTITCMGDLYVGMREIRTDIDQDSPKEEFGRWYDYCARCYSIQSQAMELDNGRCTRLSCKASDFIAPNYDSWLKKCPIKSDIELTRIERDIMKEKKFRKKQEEKYKKFREELIEISKQSDF